MIGKRLTDMMVRKFMGNPEELNYKIGLPRVMRALLPNGGCGAICQVWL